MTELDKCYELLGVRPGVSVAELKAAYKDMAKVWHPDRFAHDPRLQQKAQEKLKEINEAYEQLVAGKTPRPRPAPPTRSESTHRGRTSRSNSFGQSRPLRWHWAALPVLLFVVVFIYTTRSLIKPNNQNAPEASEQTEASGPRSEAGVSSSTRVNNEAESTRTKSKAEATQLQDQSSGAAAVEPVSAAAEPVKTITVTIDPNTGLLARPDCPAKTRMTYPSGSEPHGYCTATHGPAAASDAKESKLKSFARRVASPGKWIDSNSNKEKSSDQQK